MAWTEEDGIVLSWNLDFQLLVLIGFRNSYETDYTNRIIFITTYTSFFQLFKTAAIKISVFIQKKHTPIYTLIADRMR